MKLIADSGSTKTDWCAIGRDGSIHRFASAGINPYYQSQEEIEKEIRDVLSTNVLREGVEEVFFYGAGCTPEKSSLLTQIFTNLFGDVKIDVYSDLMGAARAMCGKEDGIVAILGTGSNSALYVGQKIIQNTPALGFILGDEGSGAYLGKNFVNLLLKNQLSEDMKEHFFAEYKTDTANIIEQVYRQPFPNRFLASFVPFINKNKEHPPVREMIKSSFNDFLEKNIFQYPNSKKYPIHFVGSVAYYFADVLRESVVENKLHLGIIEQSPIEGLISFHSH